MAKLYFTPNLTRHTACPESDLAAATLAAHPCDPDLASFVPGGKDEKRYPVDGALAVPRTRGRGKRFDVLRKELARQPSHDVVYRHGLDIDFAGNCLAVGSTIGNLWLSDDQGDDWRQLSGYLPPIYRARFAS